LGANVETGAEGAASAGEHQAGKLRIAGRKVQSRHQLAMHFGREAVERRGAIEAQRANGTGIAGEN
jgi:hypothetical protein